MGFTGTALTGWLGVSSSEPQCHCRWSQYEARELVLSASLPQTGSTSAQGPAGSLPSAGSGEEELCLWDQ